MHPLYLFFYVAVAAMVTFLFRFLVQVARKDTALPGGRVIAIPLAEVALVVILVTGCLYFAPPKLSYSFVNNALIVSLGALLMWRHRVALQPVAGIPWSPLGTLAIAVWISLALCPMAAFLSIINEYLCKELKLPGEGQSIRDILLHSNDLPLLIKVLVLAVFIAPAAEEFLMRSIVQSALRQYFSAIVAVLITSVIFASLHLTPVVFLPLLLVGIVFGIAFERKGSLPFNVLIHSSSNAIFIVATLLERVYGRPDVVP